MSRLLVAVMILGFAFEARGEVLCPRVTSDPENEFIRLSVPSRKH